MYSALLKSELWEVCPFLGLGIHPGRVSLVYSLRLNCLWGNICESKLKEASSSVHGRVVYHHLKWCVMSHHCRMGCFVSSVLSDFSLGVDASLCIAWRTKGSQAKFFLITFLHHKKSPFNKLEIYSSWTMLCLFRNLFRAELFPCLPVFLKECYLVVSVNLCCVLVFFFLRSCKQ